MKEPKLLTLESEFHRLNITQNQFGPVLLSRLGKGLYKNELHCVREYIQNAVDGINKFNREYSNLTVDRTIRIDAQGDAITLSDNGIGMNKDDILTAISFGASLKDKSYDAGFLGIGIFSGGSIADKARLYTTKKGEPKAFVFEIDFKYIEENYKNYKSGLSLLKEATRFQELDEDAEKHYCQTILYVDKEHQYLVKDDADIRKYISLVCPVGFPNSFKYKNSVDSFLQKYGIDDQLFDIRLNKEPVFRPHPTKIIAPKSREVRFDGQLVGTYWYCENESKGFILDAKGKENEDIRYITYRWRNFLIDDPQRRDYAARQLFGGRPDLMKRYFGDIHILNFEDIEPDLERTGFRHTSGYEDFKKAITHPGTKSNIHLLRTEARTASSQAILIKQAKAAKTTCQKIQGQDLSTMNVEELWEKKTEIKNVTKELEGRKNKAKGKAYKGLTIPEKKGVDTSISSLHQTMNLIGKAIEENNRDKTQPQEPADVDSDSRVTIAEILEILKKHLKDQGSIYNAIVKDLESLVKGK